MPSSRQDPSESVLICPFAVIVDTREQAPWHFTGITDQMGRPMVVPLVTDTHLVTGDYSIPGFENVVTIERKSFSDFRSSITAERDRFERQMERMSAMEYAAVVIESGWDELLSPQTESKVAPTTISRTIQSWSIRYGVHFWPMPGRRVAEVWAFRLLQMFYRQKTNQEDA